MREIDTVEVLQTLSRPMQLLSHSSEGRGGKSEVTHQLQSVCMVILNEFHDVPMRHPL
jgi:hypothetical protein